MEAKINNNVINNKYQEKGYTRPKLKASFGENTSPNDLIKVYQDASVPQIQQINLVLKANASIKTPGYREIQTFDVPFHDKGKLYKLDNGQKVVIISKPGPTTIKTFVNVGSFNEPDKIRGISHYIEHNLFNGSKDLAPGEFVRELSHRGAKYNASTDFAGTNYFIAAPIFKSEDLEKFINMHANLMLYPSYTPEMLEKEKGPVISEIEMYEDDPYDKVVNLLLKNLFNINNNYQGLVAGSTANISNLTRKDVLDYYNRWYSPDNMTTVVVGDVNPDETIKMVSKYFGTKDSKAKDINEFVNKNNKHCENLDNPITQTKRVDIKSNKVDTCIVAMGFTGPKNNDVKDTFAVLGLCSALTGNNNARLTKALKPFNVEPECNINIISPDFNDPQAIQLASNFAPGSEEEGLKTVYSVIYDMANNPVSDNELNIIKNNMKNGLNLISESSMGLSDLLGEALVGRGNLRAFTDIEKNIDELTAQDIQNAAKKYLDLNKTSIVVLHPKDQEVVTNPSKINFKGKAVKPLSFGSTVKSMDAGTVTEYNLNNNLRLALNNSSSSVRAAAVLQIKSDEIYPAKPGTAEILSLMLNKGTRKYSEEQLHDIIALNNLGITPLADAESILISANCPDDKLPMSVDIMKEIVYNPDLSEEKFNKAKEELRVMLSSETKNPSDRVLETLYPNHPYGYTPRLVLENIDRLELKDVKDLYNSLINNSQGRAVVAANFDKNPQVKDEAFKSLADLPKYREYKFVNNFKYEPLKENTVITESEERNQAHIVQMFKIQESGNVKDMAAMLLLNDILGGTSDSRLFNDLREKQKLAYRVGSKYITNGKAGQLAMEIKTTTKNSNPSENAELAKNVQRSLDGFKKHIQMLSAEPPPPSELEDAKLSLKSSLIFGSESTAGKASFTIEGMNTPYGTTYNTELLKAIDEIQPVDIQKAAIFYLNKPSVVSLIASKDTIAANKDYLSKLSSNGKVVSY